MNNDRIWKLLTRKLSGEATLTELQELELLVSRFPASEKMVTSVSDSWASGNATDSEFLEATYLQHLERMKTKGFLLSSDEPVLDENNAAYLTTPNSLFSFKKMVIASIVVILIASVWLLSKQPKQVLAQQKKDAIGQVVTDKGSRTKMQLPDGSNVWLNAGSTLNYSKNFDTDLREVYLSGEAFFDVVKNPKQPFIIHTSKMDVRVLGTQFNVKAYEQDKTFETSLIKGSVEVFLKNDPNRKYVLKPNQKLVLQNELPGKINTHTSKSTKELPNIQLKELAYVNGTDIDIETSWTKNILSFEDEAFSEVAKKMERWFDVIIEFKGKKWEEQFLSGSFENESLEQAMTALKFSTGFNFKIEGKKIIIY